jgi:hypothetical protein
MAYNNFTLESVKDRFDLKLIDNRFCELLPICDPQSEFLAIFDESSSLAEVAKSEKLSLSCWLVRSWYKREN